MRFNGNKFKTLSVPCAKKHLFWCVSNLVTWKKEKKEQPWGGFQIILAWKSGIDSNVSTLWSKEAPHKSSFWSTSQNWSWDLSNQFELNEFARPVLYTVQDGAAVAVEWADDAALSWLLSRALAGPRTATAALRLVLQEKKPNAVDQKASDSSGHLFERAAGVLL